VIWSGREAWQGVGLPEKLAALGGVCHDHEELLRIRKYHLQSLHENNLFVFESGKAWT
jgi:hypothetical protein